MTIHTRLSAPALAILFAASTPAQQTSRQSNMELVGYNDLQARSAYQPVIQKQGDRWIAYIGHHAGVQPNPLTGQQEQNGTSIVDVTDPARPRYLAHIPGESDPGAAGEAERKWCASAAAAICRTPIKSKFYMLRSFGESAHEMWDVTDPAEPTRLNVIVGGLRDTHKSWWECDTGIAYLVGGVVGWRTTRMAMIYDLSDPANPEVHSQFRLAGPAAGRARSDAGEPARPPLHRTQGQPRVLCLRQFQGRRSRNRRPRKTAKRSQGTDRREPALSNCFAARFSGGRWRAQRLPAASACSFRSSPSRKTAA